MAAAGSRIVACARPTTVGTTIRSVRASAGTIRMDHRRASDRSVSTNGPSVTGSAWVPRRFVLAIATTRRANIHATPAAYNVTIQGAKNSHRGGGLKEEFAPDEEALRDDTSVRPSAPVREAVLSVLAGTTDSASIGELVIETRSDSTTASVSVSLAVRRAARPRQSPRK